MPSVFGALAIPTLLRAFFAKSISVSPTILSLNIAIAYSALRRRKIAILKRSLNSNALKAYATMASEANDTIVSLKVSLVKGKIPIFL